MASVLPGLPLFLSSFFEARPPWPTGLALVGLACSGTPVSETSPPGGAVGSEGAGAPVVWTLAGRVTPFRSTFPAALPFEGGRDLVAQCAGVEPCAAERWRAPDGRHRDLLLRGASIDELSSGEAWPGAWQRVDGSLAACLRHPLFHPPAGDTGARRELVQRGSDWSWVLHFAGAEPCRLEGLLILDARGADIDTSALLVEGVPWSAGGRQLLDEHLSVKAPG